MSESPPPSAAADVALSPVHQAISTIRLLRERLLASERRATAPIAIIGMACRFPGADGLAAFWRVLREGVDAIGDIPADRWNVDDWYDPDPDAPAKMSARQGGFLENVADFDAEFFGISDREAVSIDPQHRLLLEVGWEALENAGLTADAVFGSKIGVFVGISSFDYASLRGRMGDPAQLDAYHAAGISHSAAAGRLAYYLGLQGPSMAIDTACSSSLVAIHLACQSLRLGECGAALAGGINLILSPELHVTLSKARMLAPDGRCKAFDGAADGFVRSEGCGVLVLKLLDDALRDGDRIQAVIRGSACNQDGRSSGLSAPNGPAQTAVIKAAWQAAGIQPAEISYIEAHGTGTALGDPIEAGALAAALEDAPEDHLLPIGSVKTNLGHMEAAAGVGGVIKAVLALENEMLPASLHYRAPSPEIDWARSRLKVVSESTPWPRAAKSRIAGVSSFGFSGTNAHIVLEEAPLPLRAPKAGSPRRSWSHRHYWFPIAATQALSSEESWRSVVAAASRQADQVPIDLNLHTYAGKYRALDALASAYIVRTLVELGAYDRMAQTGAALTPDELIRSFGVSPLYRRLVETWLNKLAGEGYLLCVGNGFAAQRALAVPPVAGLEAEAEPLFADAPMLLDYVKGCGALLTAVIKEEISALETLFPGGGRELAEGLYHRAALSRYFNAIAAEAARSFIAGRSGRVRILEVGGGTGGVTGSILSSIPPGSAYTFTDVSPFFLEAAARRFSEFEHLDFAILDLERSPQAQGFKPGVYDLVVAANVLHATADVGQTLDFVRGLLAPGGALLLYEVTDPPAYFDVSIALIEGWQKSSDDIRGRGPLLNTEQWKALLPRRGFDRVEAWPSTASPAIVLGSRVFLARADGAGAGSLATSPGTEAPPRQMILRPQNEAEDGIRALLDRTPLSEHREILMQFVRRQVGLVLRRPEAREIPSDRRLMDLGLDSLMAVELRNILTRKLQLQQNLPVTLMFDYPSISDVADFLFARLHRPRSEDRPIARASPSARITEAQLAALSDAEVETLLNRKLERL